LRATSPRLKAAVGKGLIGSSLVSFLAPSFRVEVLPSVSSEEDHMALKLLVGQVGGCLRKDSDQARAVGWAFPKVPVISVGLIFVTSCIGLLKHKL